MESVTMKGRLVVLVSVAAALTVLPCVVRAAEGTGAAEAPAGQASPGVRTLSAEVVNLKGSAQVKPTGAEWKDAQVGTKIAGGDEICTGLRSSMDLKFADGDYISSLMVVGPLTQCALVTFARAQEEIRTQIFLRQGTLKAGVTKGAIKTDMKIETPDAVAAVAGTEIAKVSSSPDKGFQLLMGNSGLLNIGDPSGFNSKEMGAADSGSDQFLTAVYEQRLQALFSLLAQGYTAFEAAAAMNNNSRINFNPGERASRRGFLDPDSVRRRSQGQRWLVPVGPVISEDEGSDYPYTHEYPP